MAQSALFSSGIEFASFVTNSVLLRKSWDVISCRHKGIISHKGEGLSWNVYKEPDSDLTIIAFEATLDSSNLQADLVTSSVLREEKFSHFDFLCTKVNPIFSVNSTAVSLFRINHQSLDQLKSEINSSTLFIVTGCGLGGSVASLFTISLLNNIWVGKNRPLCITFGSPLIGDKKLQQAISRSPIWNSCFLHIVSLEDPLRRLLIVKHSASTLTPQINAYMPFGTFLICSDVNSTCFENPNSALELLMAMGQIYVQNQGFQYADYGNIVENFNHKVICKDLTTLAEKVILPESNSVLASSISLQLRSLGLTPHMQQQQQNININNLETKMEKLEERFKRGRVFSYKSKKLNQMKAYMAQLEWYKKHTKNQGIGYYDNYKNMDSPWSREVVGFHKRLTNYWDKMVAEAKIMPQKRGAAFRKSWLYGGTSYRRMVEPLAIAQYYREGKKDYVTKNRPEHFILLEEWYRNETTEAKTINEEVVLTSQNSYSWECVEEALRSRQQSMVVEEREDYLSIISNEENDEATSTMCSSLTERIDQLILSNREFNVVIENEENLNTMSKNNEEDSSCYGACVDACILSRSGSVIVKEKEENIERFELRIDEAFLSRRESFAVKDNEAFLSHRESIAVNEKQENLNRRRKKNVEAILTIDSCFWAHVEEACISCNELKVIEEKEETLKKLVVFEEYVYELLKNYAVSPEIFLQQSSYMRWWNEYKAIKGTSYNSRLASFMSDARKRVLYGLGAYDFP